MGNIITFENRGTELKVYSFDNDKELEIAATESFDSYTVWLSPNEVNKLIIHLAQSLIEINEPIDLLTNQ